QNKKLSEDILIFNNYRMNEAFDIKDPDSDYDTYDDSTSSITVEKSIASEGAIVNESIEIQPFIWDKFAFKQAQILANKKKIIMIVKSNKKI
ncbi:8721_t:CDS:1, partial [Racocetra persica]